MQSTLVFFVIAMWHTVRGIISQSHGLISKSHGEKKILKLPNNTGFHANNFKINPYQKCPWAKQPSLLSVWTQPLKETGYKISSLVPVKCWVLYAKICKTLCAENGGSNWYECWNRKWGKRNLQSLVIWKNNVHVKWDITRWKLTKAFMLLFFTLNEFC